MRYHLRFVRMAIINKSTNNKCWQGYEEMRTLLHYWWKCSLMHLDLPFDLAIPIGDISEGTQNTNSKKHKHPYEANIGPLKVVPEAVYTILVSLDSLFFLF